MWLEERDHRKEMRPEKKAGVRSSRAQQIRRGTLEMTFRM
jgi:hypothetical protein